MLCNDCGHDKPTTDFYPSLKTRCKECQKKRMRDVYTPEKGRHRNQRLGKDYFKKKQNEWRNRNPDKVREIKKRAYEKRKQESGHTSYESTSHKRKRMAEYREQNREVIREKSRERYHKMIKTEEGKLYWRALVHRRRDKSVALSGQDLKSILDAHTVNGVLRCRYCERELEGNYHIDHMTPLSRGGTNNIDNLCVACPDCNLNKGTMTVPEFLAYRVELIGV